MPFSDSFANSVLNYTFSKIEKLTAPQFVYIGLCSNDPESDGGTFNELSGFGYARVLISQEGETYPNLISSASGRIIKNQYQINWTKATGGDWAEVNGFGLFSSATGGTPFYYGKLKEPVTCVAGAVFLFDPNTLQISFLETDSESLTEIVASQKVTFGLNEIYGCYMGVIEMNDPNIVSGNTYKVIWDNAVYTCTAFTLQDMVAVGNAGILGGADTGEPFGISYMDGGLAFGTTSTQTNHTVGLMK